MATIERAECLAMMGCPDVTFSGYHLPTVARLAREQGSPELGDLAWQIWKISTADALPVEMALRFMWAAGYKAFVGYPLQRTEAQHVTA
jgi:hypothetical protein